MSHVVTEAGHFKDAILDRLAEHANVAQFVSFGPGQEPELRFVRLVGDLDAPQTVETAIAALLASSGEASINIRSFDPRQPRGHDFLYGLKDVGAASKELRKLAEAGLYTIANETIDIHDGGVSGVAAGDVVEFAPEDTPRAVEKPGTARLDREVGMKLLTTVYGFEPELSFPADARVEFSLHPRPRGTRATHTVIWEKERISDAGYLQPDLRWPNRFSRFVGDKAFGLLVADAVGLPVPTTTVIARKVAPFSFGQPTGSGEFWLRTAPVVQVPGRFRTLRGWTDPFRLLEEEDPAGDQIASVLAQEGVIARYAGAAMATQDGSMIEGVPGDGDAFMLGKRGPEPLPREVVDDVRTLHAQASLVLGDSRLEWVHDGAKAWVLQLHIGATPSSGLTIFPGEPTTEHEFPVDLGLEALRQLVEMLADTGEGIVLLGDVGITSHFGDVLRRAQIPSRLKSS